MAYKVEGMEVSSTPFIYFSLWKDGSRLTGGTKFFKVFNYGVETGEEELKGGAVMILYGPLTKWSEE